MARSESSFRRAEPRGWGAAAVVGIALLLVSWALLHVGFYDRSQIIDTPTYQRYGDLVVDGKVPYRDFGVEYPPGALPMFILPSLAGGDDYRGIFEWLMWACGAATMAFLAVALTAAGASEARLYGAVAFAGLAPLALGSVVLTRYDLWPAALTAAALAALLAGRERLGFGALALAAAAKVYPAALLPLAIVYAGRRRGAGEAAIGLGVFAAVVAVVLLPFAVLAPDGLRESLERQVGRPLQIESLGAAFVLAAHQVDGTYVPSIVSSFGSQNLEGSLADALGTVQTALQACAVIAVWLVFASGRGSREGLLVASAAAVTAFVAFGKVLSPQFLIWLVPLVPLVAGGSGLVASGILAAALVTTQLWFPARYWDVVALGGVGWLVLVRDLILVALFAVLATAINKRRGPLRTE